MHLKSLSLKGFKSFPERTRLDFGPGVSVVVGPNGSGKSNITDAVLWAMGEQSPLAVRGQSMQDVIFGGGHGQQARGAAEVELVLDNVDGALPLDFSEISILRRLDRTGEGEYRLNGARCRLVDVLEILSDTGLGKEGHSIVSQGRVESIVTSRPRDRRLLIEEAAGLGKHRKRRRRAQLKLARTQDNLDRALDVEREARSHLRPLKRQAEAAELHERLELQSLQARWELARGAARSRVDELADAERQATAARGRREQAERALADVAARREQAEQALARRSERREQEAARCFASRTAADRVGLRLEGVRAAAAALEQRLAADRLSLAAEGEPPAVAEPGTEQRIVELMRELDGLEHDEGLAELDAELERAAEDVLSAARRASEAEQALAVAQAAAEESLAAHRAAEGDFESARRSTAAIEAELAGVNQFLEGLAGVGAAGGRTLAEDLGVTAGYELALTAALGHRLRAAVVTDLAAGADLLDRAGRDGGAALVAGPPANLPAAFGAPISGAELLSEHVDGARQAVVVATALLRDVWVVEDLTALPADFDGVAVTRSGRIWLGGARELRQLPEGGDERLLAERNRRDALVADAELAGERQRTASAAVQTAATALAAADAARDEAGVALREARDEDDRAADRRRRAEWRARQRRETPEGPAAIRRAQIEAELAAERRIAASVDRAHAEHAARAAQTVARIARAEELLPSAQRLVVALEQTAAALAERVQMLERALDADRAEGAELAAELRACASEEADLHAKLRTRGDELTAVEVRAQQVRDAAADAESELGELAERLGLEAAPADQPLSEEERTAFDQRVARLARRREQLGPVNPLAKDEYADALARVEELELQRTDLEAAMRELQSLISETDRHIRETFESTLDAAARYFEEIVEQLFPGGRGRLRLVREDVRPRSVLGGGTASSDEAGAGDDDAQAEAEETRESDPDEEVGVEIELTPAGKSMKRLSLLSGGEKSLTALAFLFAVFLARPCPFYILDEVEAALDDLNIDRFLGLLRRYSSRAQFIVVTHQKRTMEAADVLYGVSMGSDGVSKVISHRLPAAVEQPDREQAPAA
ncbi:MAG TPA: AAA family ATPase [Solirubrobacteraceae bacterium]|nr:AAA family ATPase [Solirubrobacteraceae bacterium]